ncbi:sensor histidine kinase [Paenibacillus piri]|uniref:histidine kinase n=1 Tax=Paenibacillus piri TaxID=2547395 RepID=A0A4R5KP66_9BACL|nr:ATP-binding protein [Paenibacillus piri]TDF97493.1 ATP-binding protein [Paenibacillus piri]
MERNASWRGTEAEAPRNEKVVVFAPEISGSSVIVGVKDTGAGIAEEDLPYIFDRYYTSNKSRNVKDGGTGLGLAICKEIIEHYHGRIWACNNPERGCTFYFTLPLYLDTDVIQDA